MPAKTITASSVVKDMRARRPKQGAAKIEWYIKKVSDKITMTLEQRTHQAVFYLAQKIVSNLSVAVGKGTDKKGHVKVTQRSKPGEFPRADTERLMRDVPATLTVKRDKAGSFNGYVGTTLDYGLMLEMSPKLQRGFLVRTLNEERSRLRRLLTGPIK